MASKRKPSPRTGGRRIKAKPEAELELPSPGMEEFETRQRANEGHRIPLYTADGRLTAHWLLVRGVDSDLFTRAKTKQTRRLSSIVALETEDQKADAIADAKAEMLSALVKDWSFDKPCTLENVKAFLINAPQIADEIDKFASRRTLFFKPRSEVLKATGAASSP